MTKLSKAQREVLEVLIDSGITDRFYLAGGTAISIKYNHRPSLDFDFFSDSFFSFTEKEDFLKKIESYNPEIVINTPDTLAFVLNGIYVSFFKYPYPLLKEPESFLNGKVKLASDYDLIAMKVSAIVGRGVKRDFFDLWFLMKKHRLSLKDVIEISRKKFGKVFSESVFLKAVVYFSDAEKEKAFSEIEEKWEEVKRFFINQLESYLKE